MYSASGRPPWQMQSAAGYGQTHNQPAYIPVPTRNPYAAAAGVLQPPPAYVPPPLHHTPAPPPPPHVVNSPAPSNETRKKIEWPPAVREYVNRCFAAEHQIAGIDKPEMEKRLREVITNAAHSNMLHSYNWETMPLAQEMIQEDRKRATLGLQSVPSSFLHQPPPPPPLSFPAGSFVPPPHFGSETLRKRKSSELSTDIDSPSQPVQPPWRTNKKGGSLEDRITMPDKRQKIETGAMSSKSNHSLDQRRKRFEDVRSGSNSPRKQNHGGSSPAPPSEPLGPVVGRSQKLEKNYFRLTAPPKPEEVRPPEVLQQTLELLKKKWLQDNNYGYICDQFKSLRQDLTVQHIKTEFTINVYEIHARIALEKGDLGEYNQCQTQLRALYKQNLGGHPVEFKAYQILYYIYTCNRTDMNDLLSDLTPADKKTKAVVHALAVRSALALGNYHQFFKLYLSPPNMGAYLMDMFIERERLAALAAISKA